MTRHNARLIIADRQEAARNLVVQYHIERAAKRMAWVGIAILTISTLCSIITPFRPSHL